MRSVLWRVALAVLWLGLAGCSRQDQPAFSATDITGAGFGRSLLGFTDHHGAPKTLADYRGKALLVFFGYTLCPDVCPTTLARLAEVMKQLGSDAGRVQVLFITLDPARDTPERLANYVPWFYPSFVGLHGDAATTEAAAREFKVFYARSTGSKATGYMIDHSAGVYAFDPAGNVRLYIKDSASVEAIVSDLRQLLAGK